MVVQAPFAGNSFTLNSSSSLAGQQPVTGTDLTDFSNFTATIPATLSAEEALTLTATTGPLVDPELRSELSDVSLNFREFLHRMNQEPLAA